MCKCSLAKPAARQARQQIIDDELNRYKKDLADQMRIVEADIFARMEKLLHNKVPTAVRRNWPRAPS